MPSLEDFEIVVNPSREIFYQLVEEIIRDEGWSACSTDYESHLTTHSKYWAFIAIEKATRKPAGSVGLAMDEHSAIAEPLYLIGMFYCKPKYRGIGLGSKLFAAAMQIPPKDANVTLAGVLNMYEKYRSRYGFKHIGLTLSYTEFLCKDVQKVQLAPGYTTKSISEVSWSDIEAYENTINPRPHPKFLKTWTVNVGTHSRIAYNSSGNPVGYICLREDLAGDLGCAPLYAENKDIALVLLMETLATIDLTKFRKVHLLNPKSNSDVEKIASEISGGKHDSHDFSHAQFTQKIVEIPEQKIFSFIDCGTGFL